MVVDLAVPEQAEQSFDLIVRNRAPQTYSVYVRDWDKHRGFIGDNAQMIKTASGSKNGFLLDPFDDAETMIRVNDLVSDCESHGSPCWQRYMEGRIRTGSLLSIQHGALLDNAKGPESGLFRSILAHDLATSWHHDRR
jgi:hypothetical protein